MHRSRSAIRKKDIFKLWRRNLNEPTRKFFRRLVREPREDHLTQTTHLVLDRLHDVRMTMTVGDHPPGRYGVEYMATVRGHEPRPFGFGNRHRLGQHRMLCERMPYWRHRFHRAASFSK